VRRRVATDWQREPIESLCSRITSGGTPSRQNSDFFQGGTVLWVKTKELRDWYIEDTEEKITTDAIAKSSAKLLPKNTVLMAMYGDGRTITSLGLLRHESACNQACCAMIVDPTKCSHEFLFYSLMLHRKELLKLAYGGAQRNLNARTIRQFKIPTPSRRTQDRITGILSAYDDLIENNTRRIKILEEMAQMIYREWFVNFRFPRHDKVKMVESECGRKPHGWMVKPLGEVAAITMGLSPKGDTYNEDGDGLPLINGPVEFGERFTKAVKWTTAPTKLCEEGDLIICVRGSTTGRYVKSDATYCLGRGVCALSSNYQCFVDLLFQDQLPTLLAKTSGSTFPSWTGPLLKSHLVLCPPVEELDRFETMVRPLSAAVLVFSRQIRNLRTARDVLLPKLISGEISVEQAETEAVAQTV
jgi:type I restriction enzyme S subunit